MSALDLIIAYPPIHTLHLCAMSMLARHLTSPLQTAAITLEKTIFPLLDYTFRYAVVYVYRHSSHDDMLCHAVKMACIYKYM